MSRDTGVFTTRRVLRGLVVGFSLVVLLVVAAVYVAYQGSRAIHDQARELVREHLLTEGRGAALEYGIERRSQELLDDLELVLGLCLAVAVGSAIAATWTTRRAFDRLEWQAEELAQVSWHMLQDQEVTARRFSHEMHDELGQTLTGLKGMLKQVRPDDLEAERASLVSVLDEALTGVRELSQLLRPVILDDFGLDAGLRWLTERVSERTGIAVDYTSDLGNRLDEQLETHLFRIAQEALTNIARHSEATRARVSLAGAGDTVTLVIEDNGRGLPAVARTRPSLGMVGMRARARHVGGTLEVQNQPSGGVRLTIRAPLLLAAAPDDDHAEAHAYPAR